MIKNGTMVSLLMLTWVCLGGPSTVAAADRPILREGDRWEFKASTRESVSNTTDRLNGLYEVVFRGGQIEVFEVTGKNPLLEIALELERIALEDDYFVSRKLYPNVDFYSGIILKALGIPTSMYTVMFALARSAGWIAQWMEMMTDPDFRIGRPRQLYIGTEKRDYVPMEKRSQRHD